MACLFISARLYQTSNNVAILENVYHGKLLNLCFEETPNESLLDCLHDIGENSVVSVPH